MDNPSILSHISIGTNDFERAVAFYDRVLPALGCKRIMEHPGAIAYGKQYPEFWVGIPFDNQPATVGNGTHIGLIAPTKEAVHAFYEAALAAGGVDEGAPGDDPIMGNLTTVALSAIQMGIRSRHPTGLWRFERL
jgi:catechol 2,3-dioxygenase-like lactoylglutathione lyase family enzyme